MMTTRIWVLLLVSLCWVQAADKNNRNERLFLANYSATTQLVLSFTTSTVPSTCVAHIKHDTACTGRSNRVRRKMGRIVETAQGVDSSMDELPVPLEGEREAKKFFTVWTTAKTTTTLTTTATNTNLIITVSLGCVGPAVSVGPVCVG